MKQSRIDWYKQNQNVGPSMTANEKKAIVRKVICEELLKSLQMKHEWLKIKDNQLHCKVCFTCSSRITADLLKII